MAARSVLLALLLVACAAAGADAHGYRNKKLKKFIPVEQRYHNHVPVPLLKPQDMPKRFDWCAAAGRHKHAGGGGRLHADFEWGGVGDG